MKKLLTALLMASLLVCSVSPVVFAANKAAGNKTAKKATGNKTAANKATAKKATKTKTDAKPAEKQVEAFIPKKISEDFTETVETLTVTPEWLNENKNDVIIVDCRFDTLYHAGHIPGAVSAPWTYFVNTSVPNGTEKYGTILPAAQLAKKIGALGINGKKTVVCYSDAGDWGQGTWTVIVLRTAGIADAKMLDGGIYAWKNAKYPLTTKIAKNAAVSFSIGEHFMDEYVVNTEAVKEAMGKPNTVIADVRTTAEYEGKIAPFKEKRKGHIPGAIHLPMDFFFSETGHVKTAEEIKAELTSKGIKEDTPLILYDTCGVRAGCVVAVCRLAGYKNAVLYDNSFQAWAGNAELPVETSKEVTE